MYGFEDDYSYDEQFFSIEDTRQDLDRVVKYFRSLPYHEHAMQLSVVDYRKLPMSVADDADCFWIDEELLIGELPEWIRVDSLGIVKKNKYMPMFGRLIYPVKDVKGDVMGFCGWDPFVTPKYLDSKNYGYKAKLTTVYGMEKLPEYYSSTKPIFVTEGIVDALYLRWKGYCSLALLGSHMTPYVTQILKRFGNRLIMIPDNDEAGTSLVQQVKRTLPKSIIIQSRYGKDIDGCRKLNDGEYENELLSELSSLNNPFVKTKLLIRV